MQQPLLDDLKQTLLMVDKTNVTKLEDIPLSKIGSSFSLNLKHAESKKDYQNSCGTVAEIKLNATSKEFTSVPELLEDKGDSDNEYQPLFESDPLTALYSFLNSMDIDRHDILQAGISESHLLRLHQKETGWFSFLQWCSIDHILEKNLQWLLLNSKDLNESISGLGLKRLRPHGRSILLKSTWGLMKAYGARGFAKGIETSLSKSVHYFIYAMLAYRLINLMLSNQSNFEGSKI